MAATREEAAGSLREAAAELRRIASARAASAPRRVTATLGPKAKAARPAPTQADRMEALAEALHQTE